MSDEPALLAAIRAHPDEDTPRLIYADWLDENGQPERAEFIRLQCLPEPTQEQEGRAIDLEEQNRGRWLARLGVPQFTEARWEFRRGFPEFLQTDAGLFLDRFDAFARVPWLRSLSLHGAWGGLVRDLCGREWPRRWIELELFDPDDPDIDSRVSMDALANCAQAQQLRRLRLVTSAYRVQSRNTLQAKFGSRLVID